MQCHSIQIQNSVEKISSLLHRYTGTLKAISFGDPFVTCTLINIAHGI